MDYEELTARVVFAMKNANNLPLLAAVTEPRVVMIFKGEDYSENWFVEDWQMVTPDREIKKRPDFLGWVVDCVDRSGEVWVRVVRQKDGQLGFYNPGSGDPQI